jgi:hypothetical protein|tara:strand:+ start:436 stop:639 length:204 start_codon:yes stop_codon:yes gene_type:complete
MTNIIEHEEVISQANELKEFERNPRLLQMPDQRWYIEQLVDDGETKEIRNKAKSLLQAVPCPTCASE